MKPETIKALRDSIEHWERMRDGKQRPGEQLDAHSCALCRRFDSDGDDWRCQNGDERCPIYERTGYPGCGFGPYLGAFGAWLDSKTDWPTWQTAAQRMIDFLRSLLPEGEQTEPAPVDSRRDGEGAETA